MLMAKRMAGGEAGAPPPAPMLRPLPGGPPGPRNPGLAGVGGRKNQVFWFKMRVAALARTAVGSFKGLAAAGSQFGMALGEAAGTSSGTPSARRQHSKVRDVRSTRIPTQLLPFLPLFAPI